MRLTDELLKHLTLPQDICRLDLDMNCNDKLTGKWVDTLAAGLPPRLAELTVNLDLCQGISDEALLGLLRRFLAGRYATKLEVKDKALPHAGLLGLLSWILSDSHPHLRHIALQVDKPSQKAHDTTAHYLSTRHLQMALADRLGRTMHASSVSELLSFL